MHRFLQVLKKGFTYMLEIGLINARIKDMQGRADVLRGYL
jgi:hypothetical protein